MAKNPPPGGHHRIGAVKNRVQVRNPVTGNWVKIDTKKRRIIDQKTDGKPFKGVRKKK